MIPLIAFSNIGSKTINANDNVAFANDNTANDATIVAVAA